jgi:hypothetical protein
LIENRINSPVRAGSAIFEAPPGWGKQVLMEQLAIRNPNTVFVQVTPDGLMGGTMYRGSLEQRLKDIPAEIERSLKNGQRVVLFIDEFHEAAMAGKSMEETRTLLERWKGPLAQGTLRIVGFSTPQEMIKVRYAAGFYGTRDNPSGREHLNPDELRMVQDFDRDPNIRPNIELRALLNRFRRISAIENGGIRPASDIELIIRDEVNYLKTHDNLTVNISDEAITEIARLSLSERAYEGHIPRTTFAIFDGILTEQSQHGEAGQPVRIEVNEVHNFVRTAEPAIARRFGITGGTPTGGTPPPSGGTRSVVDPADPAPRDPSTRVVTGAGDPSGTPPVVPAATGSGVTGIFTEDSFYEMFRSRYPQFQNEAGQIHGNYETAVRGMARYAFNQWSAAANADPAHPPVVTVDGHTFPREDFIERTFRAAMDLAARTDAAQAAELRRVYEAGRERLGEGRRLDTTSEPFRAEGLRAFEAIGR